MGKLTDQNKIVIKMINKELNKEGLTGKLAVEPVANTFTRRPRYFRYSDGIARFKVHLWDLNKLPENELKIEIEKRVAAAKKHFDL